MASRSSPAKKDDVKALLGADSTKAGGSHMESPGGGGSAAQVCYVSFDGVSSKKTDAFNDASRDLEAGGESNLLGSRSGTAENDGGHYTSGQRALRQQFVAFKKLAVPYFRESKDGRCAFYILVVLTLMNSGVRGMCTIDSNMFDPSQPNIFFVFFSHHSIGSIAFTCSGAIAI